MKKFIAFLLVCVMLCMNTLNVYADDSSQIKYEIINSILGYMGSFGVEDNVEVSVEFSGTFLVIKQATHALIWTVEELSDEQRQMFIDDAKKYDSSLTKGNGEDNVEFHFVNGTEFTLEQNGNVTKTYNIEKTEAGYVVIFNKGDVSHLWWGTLKIATPETTAPATPETTAPATPETTAPATPETTAPATPETTAPATPETTAPATPETTAPAITEKPIKLTTFVAGVKIWNDDNNENRPDSISLKLTKKVGDKEPEEVKITEDMVVWDKESLANYNVWIWVIQKLPLFEDGKLVKYTVTEDGVPEGYEVDYGISKLSELDDTLDEIVDSKLTELVQNKVQGFYEKIKESNTNDSKFGFIFNIWDIIFDKIESKPNEELNKRLSELVDGKLDRIIINKLIESELPVETTNPPNSDPSEKPEETTNPPNSDPSYIPEESTNPPNGDPSYIPEESTNPPNSDPSYIPEESTNPPNSDPSEKPVVTTNPPMNPPVPSDPVNPPSAEPSEEPTATPEVSETPEETEVPVEPSDVPMDPTGEATDEPTEGVIDEDENQTKKPSKGTNNGKYHSGKVDKDEVVKDNTNKAKFDKTPLTSDDSNMMMYMLMLFTSVIGLSGMVLFRRKENLNK